MRISGIALALALLVSEASAGIVGIDARSLSPNPGWNPATDARYATFRALFTSAGHTLTSLNSFLSVDIGGLDAVVLFHPTATSVDYTAQEIADIQTYVSSGGALFAVPEAGWSTSSTLASMNSILGPFGVQAGLNALNGSGATFTGFVPHPVTDGVTTIGVDYHRLLTVSAPATDLSTSSNDVIAAVEPSGGGRIVVIADATGLGDAGFGGDYDITSLDNRKFVQNAIEWLLLPFGDGCPGAGGFVPELTATSYAPQAGTQLGLQLDNGLGGAPATFFFGLGQAEIPMAGGCTLNIFPLFPASFTVNLSGTGAGTGAIFLAGVLPSDMGGVTFSMQAFVADPTFAHGFSNSNEIVIAVQ